MSTKAQLEQVSKFAYDEIRARFPVLDAKAGSYVRMDAASVTLQIRKAFGIEVALYLDFKPSGDTKRWLPMVRINAPALNRPVGEAMALMALLQEVTLFGAILQAQLNEFDIPFE